MRKWMIAAAMLPLIAAYGCGPENEAEQQPVAEEGPVKGVDRSHAGKAMPDVQLFDADDDEAALSEAGGKPLLVNLWASWCAPCVKELPTLQALSKRPGSPRVIAVAQEIGERPSVDAFLKGHGIEELEAWRDPKMALSGALGVQVMPTTVYYDASGKEVWRYVGDLDWSGDEAARLLSEPAAGKG